MPTRNVNLTDHNELFLARKIDNGRFKNASEAVRAGLHLLEREEQVNEIKMGDLRDAVAAGTEAYKNGDYIVIEDDDALKKYFAGGK